MDDEAVGGAAGYDDNKMILQHHQSWSGATTIATNFSPLFFPFFCRQICWNIESSKLARL